MPDYYDMGNLLDKGYEVANKAQLLRGQPSLDEVSFVMGFMACFGIVTRRVDIGISPEAPTDLVLDSIHQDLVDFGRRVVMNQELQNAVRDTINGFKH